MNAQNFCYWLQGYAEIMKDQQPTQEHWKIIVKHLDLVFENVTKDVKIIDQRLQDPLADWYHRQYEFPDAWKDRLPEGVEKFWLHSVDPLPWPKDGSLSTAAYC